MAKVMISVPDDLLERLDARARANQETRSGFLRRLAEREIGADDARQRRHFEELLEKASAPMGGDAAQLIREDRESH
jgi:metal-responsive CopG/Arc/MetJ family transcriptional regulator